MIKAKIKFDSNSIAGDLADIISDAIEIDEDLEHLAESEKLALNNLIYSEVEKYFHDSAELD